MADTSVASELGTITTKLKVHVSARLLAAAGWSTEEGPLALIAQPIYPGRIRLHLETDIAPAIAAKRRELEESGGEDSGEKIAVLMDRYREAKLYKHTSGGDIQLTEIVAAHMRIAMKEDRTVYIEAKRPVIDVMSLEGRARRLDDLEQETSV